MLGAGGPEAVFGPRSGDPADRRAARRTYRQCVFLLHPDRAGDATAFLRLAELYRRWQAVDRTDRVTLHARVLDYELGDVLAQGSVATVYRCSEREVVKIARRPSSNRFLHGEADAYRTLRRLTDRHRWLQPYYPRLLDVAAFTDDAGTRRQFNVLSNLTDGFVTLADVHRAYPRGLDGRDWAWMYRRLLRALAGAHLARLVHGAVLADNVLIHPQRHGVVLIGWSFATETGCPLPGLVRSGAYPPEALAGRPVTGKADIHQLHTLMLDLLAPHEHEQIAYARGCLQDNPRLRPSADRLLDEYDDLIGRLYGPRRFRPFSISPAT